MKIEKDWIVGFVDGEGCFHVSLNQNKSMSLQIQVLPEFVVVQHERDIKILHGIKDFFKCGVVRRNHGDRFCYRVRNLKHLTEIIIPFFEKNSLKTIKKYNFLRFRWIVQSMVNKKYHLTPEGLEKIRHVKNSMNRAL
jgi:hypothetical protein